MIPPMILAHWRTKTQWGPDAQIEQDLVLTKAVIQLYSDPHLTDAFAFRGGTAMQKLFYAPPTRYSEDIDLVQVRAEPIGTAINAIRELVDPWLGNPSWERKKSRFTMIYRFESEMPPVQRMRLKIEINTGEHFTVLGTKRRPLHCESEWFKGSAEALTYEVEELLGTKMRALFQRKKGRDLFDLAMALKRFPKLDMAKTIHCFQKYMEHGKTPVSRAQFEANLALKLTDAAFRGDVQPLLAQGTPAFDVDEAGLQVKTAFLALLPGDSWKGPLEKEIAKKKDRRRP
ncbi:nucleotidyl transferase AbiEii/AbiGii toxin family protein [Bdellovibrionota bacterium FG-1]